MEKLCTKCGTKYPKEVKFCTKCGIKLEDLKKEEPKPQAEQPMPPPAQKKPERVHKMPKQPKPVDKILIPAVLIAVILSIVAIILPMVMGDATLSAGSVGSDELASNSVTGAKITDGAITDDDINYLGISKFVDSSIELIDLSTATIQELTGLNVIANNSITGNKIANGSIGTSDLTDESVTSAKIVNGTIETVDIANNAITSGKILDGTITSADIATDGVRSSEIQADAVGTSEIEDGSVGTSDIGTDQVQFDDMAIKIKFGTATGATNGTTVTHGLGTGSAPSAVILTPLYTTGILDGNYVLHTNVMGITSTQFTIGLWYETFTTPPVIYEVDGSTFTSGVNVYWIAID